ncbi:MAG: DUF3667 domain-containing protein [Rhodospirillaceae bacterium]|nr:DUF3667 domain-containing protein [Rhodospirillaceae bacterium]
MQSSTPSGARRSTWTCPTCRADISTPFCATCGEHPLKPEELTLRGLLKTVIEVFSNIDSKLLRTVRAVAFRPGHLTLAFMQGVRKPYIGAIQLFLVANVLFFAVQSFTAMKVFSSDLAFRLKGQLWSEFGQDLVDARLAETGRTFAEYAPVFDHAVAVNAKSLIGLMVLPFALAPLIVFWRRHKPLAAHVVFSLHFYAFLLLLLCVPLVGVLIDRLLFGGTGVLSQRNDDIMSVMLLTACGVYLYAAIGPAYDAKGIPRLIQALLLVTAAMWIFFGYRFALLPITLYTT